MLGLGLAVTVGKRILGGVIESLMSALRGRAEYSENNTDSKAVVKDIDNYELLDKATILLTPTATSDARVHSVKTYTGDELVTNGGFDTDSDWTKGSNWSIVNGEAVHTGSGDYIEQGSLTEGTKYKVVIVVTQASGSGFPQIYMGGLTTAMTSPDTYTFYITAQSGDKIKLRGLNDCKVDSISVLDVSSDFNFDRASSATRINSSGLVQDMQSITDPELVLNGDFEDLGDDLTSPVNFLSWLQSSVDSRTANTFTVGGSGRGLYFILPENKTLKINVSGLTGSVEIRYRTTTGGAGTVLGSSDTDLYVTTTNATSNIYLRATDEGTVSVTDVSVQQVDPNDRWSLGTGWSIEDGVAVASNSSANATQETFTIDAAKTYKIDFTISDYGGGTFFITFGGNDNSSNFTANGSYTVYITPTNRVNNIFYLRASGFTGKIDNISVKDITFSTDVDLARISYDSNGDNGHILLEPTSTNLITYSENFESGTWGNSSIGTTPTLDGGYTAPDGTNTAYKISNPNQDSFWFTGVGTIADYSRTIWARTVSGTGTAQLTSHNSNTNNTFNLTETWQRFEVNSTTSETGEQSFYAVDFRGSGTLTELLVWGAQVEQLSYATSYIPTYGSTVTRATETLTGSGNSTLINSTEGVLYAEIAALANDGIKKYISLSDGSTNNDVRLYFDTNGYISALSKVGGSTQVFIQSNAYTQTNFNKIAFKYKVNDFALWINGVEVATDNSGTTNTANSLDELNFNGNNLDFYGKCKALAVFNEALSDDELELLTGVTNYGSFGELASANGYTII